VHQKTIVTVKLAQID